MNRQKLFPWITLICCCLCFGCSVGLIGNTAGIFLSPVAEGLGVGMGSISIYITIQSIAGAFGTVVIAKLLRIYKLRYLMIAGSLICFGCFMLMCNAQNVYYFYVAGLVMGVSCITFQTLPCTCVIQNWFHSKTALVTSLAMSFTGGFAAVMSPILSNIITTSGWRQAYMVEAIMLLVIMIPVSLFLRMTPHEYGLLPYGSSTVTHQQANENEGAPLSTSVFMILVCLTLCFYCMTSFASHVAKFAISVGYTLTIGATLTSITMVSNVTFKVLYGIIADKFGVFKATLFSAIVSLTGTVLWFLFAKDSYYALLVGAALFGACYSIAAVGVTIMTREIAGPKYYAATFSKLVLICSMASSAMITLNGLMYDALGSYTVCIILIIAFDVVGIIATLVMMKLRAHA